MDTVMPERKDWFSADHAIMSLAEDRLGRASFAEGLAAAVRGWKGRDSLVIALYGAWGTGKSSIKNMALDALRLGSRPDNPTVVEFNPWQFANRAQLTEAFFDQIGVAVGRSARGSKKGDRKRLLERWNRYAAYLKAGAGIVEQVRKLLLGGLIFVAFLVGITATQTWVAPMVILVLFGLAVLLHWSSRSAELVAQLIEPSAEIGRWSLEEVKEELADSLRCLATPLLVVIDDIDRLIPSEVQELFQLIKVNADFPNVVYLLFFDRKAVEKNIEKALSVSGREYLEKIVQVGFDVPAIQRAQLHQILFEGLDRITREAAVSQRFDKHRWGNLFVGGLQVHFKTLRDVNRFLSTLAFHVSLFRSESSFEVNPVDLIGLEVLRVFHPEVYRSVAASKELLTGRVEMSANLLLGRDGHTDERSRAVASIIKQAHEVGQDAVREIVKQLFPTIEWALDGSNYGEGFDETWYRELRVCSEYVFDRYFHLAIADDDISQAAMDRILAATTDRGRLRAELLALKKRGLLAAALDRLEAYKEEIALDHAESFITALFDVCDGLGPERPGTFEVSPMMHAYRIVYWYLRREPNAARCRSVLESAVRTTDGISLPVDVVSREARKAGEADKRDRCLLEVEGIRALQDLCAAKIKAAAEAGRITNLAEFRSILYRWREWAGDSVPGEYVQALVGKPQGALAFLKAFLSRSTSHTQGDYVAREHWYIRLKEIEAFVAWEVIEETIKEVSVESLQSDERRAVEAFLRAAERRRQGKPDFSVDYDDGEDDE